MYALSFPRRPGRGLSVPTATALAAALLATTIPVISTASPGERGVQSAEAGDPAEADALMARALSLEVIGHFLWTSNLSESRARQRAYELRQLARVLQRSAEIALAEAETEADRLAARRKLEVVTETSAILDDAADRLSKTRGVRRKIRILALELSRMAWKVVRENGLEVAPDEEVTPGELYKSRPAPAQPSLRARLKEPARDYLTYMRGAPDTDFLEKRFFERSPRRALPRPIAELYVGEALTLSPLDRDAASRRIWWTPPPEELAWKVEQW